MTTDPAHAVRLTASTLPHDIAGQPPQTADGMKLYLEMLLPFPMEGEDGVIVIAARRGATWHHVRVQTIDEAIAAIHSADPAAADVYVCQSRQVPGKKARSSDAAVAFKSIWLDIDVGNDKDYPTQEQAVTSLGNFIKVTSLPKPTAIVSSGYGFHVYWVIPNAVGKDRWSRLADGDRAPS